MTPKKAANSNNLCPICRKNPAAPTHHPFCSSRCADVDLGRWLKGNYAIPGEAADLPDETEDKGE